MSDFNQVSPLNKPDDERYLSDAEMDAMTDDELEAAFAIALDSMTEETYDGEVISRYLDALDRKDPMPEYPDVETSYSRFQAKMKNIYPNDASDEPTVYPRRVQRVRRVGRVLLVAVLSVAVIFGSLFTAQAMGVDIFGALARWTDETFHFEAAAPAVNAELTDALRACDMDAALMPTWSPEGFVAEEPKCTELRSKTYIDVTFTRADGQFYSVQIARYASPEGVSIGSYEKDDGPVEQYASNGRLVYIFSNLEHNTAVWSDGVFEVSIVGDLSQEELKQIFDSIGGTS